LVASFKVPQGVTISPDWQTALHPAAL